MASNMDGAFREKKYVGTILHGLGKYTCECVCVFEGIFGWRDSEGREMEG